MLINDNYDILIRYSSAPSERCRPRLLTDAADSILSAIVIEQPVLGACTLTRQRDDGDPADAPTLRRFGGLSCPNAQPSTRPAGNRRTPAIPSLPVSIQGHGGRQVPPDFPAPRTAKFLRLHRSSDCSRPGRTPGRCLRPAARSVARPFAHAFPPRLPSAIARPPPGGFKPAAFSSDKKAEKRESLSEGAAARPTDPSEPEAGAPGDSILKRGSAP